jgi:aspartyl-tRNA(Asn)/glutamyl-tRNA(Gln) amidotransferase subunit B
LPELPDDKKTRFMDDLGLSAYDAGVLIAERASAAFFEEVATGRDAKAAANWVTGSLFGALNKAGLEITASPVSAADLGALLDLIGDGTISGRIAKDVFEIMFETGDGPAKIVADKGLEQVTDTVAIEAEVDKVLAANGDKVEQYRGGKDKLFGFFVGQVMKATQGKANPKAVNEILRAKLDG